MFDAQSQYVPKNSAQHGILLGPWGVLMVKQHKNGQKTIQKNKTQGALRNIHQFFGKILSVEAPRLGFLTLLLMFHK